MKCRKFFQMDVLSLAHSALLFPIGNLVNLSKSLSPVEILLVDNRSSIEQFFESLETLFQVVF